jgi:hypothetical protein
VLARERKVIPYASRFENLTIEVELREGLVKLAESLLVVNVAPNDITEIQESAKGTDHLTRYMPFNCTLGSTYPIRSDPLRVGSLTIKT